MSVFSVKINTLNDAVSKYDNVIAEIDEQAKRFDILLREIDDSWDGLASIAFLRRMRSERVKLLYMRNYVSALRKYSKDTAEKMDAIDKLLRKLLQMWTAIWNSGSNSSSNTNHGGGGMQLPDDGSTAADRYNYQAEMAAITAAATANGEEITWNYPDQYGVQAVSCQWFSYAKLCERGFASDTGAFFSKHAPAGTISCGGNNTFTGAVSAIEGYIKNNGGSPVYNVLIQGDNSGHTALIDKAYIDGSGALKLVFSDNADYSSPKISVAPNVDGVTQTYQFLQQKEYSVSELPQVWRMSNYVASVEIYGESKK